MKLIIAGDHYAIDTLARIEKFLQSKDIPFENVGTMDSGRQISLQQIIPAVAEPIRKSVTDNGILVCGTGVGVEIGANRFKGIRAALCTSPKQAEYAKVYDDANVLCLSSWLTEDPVPILETWLESKFDNNPRRAKQMQDFDEWN
jgi:ribose 5-phosphate isomerase B